MGLTPRQLVYRFLELNYIVRDEALRSLGVPDSLIPQSGTDYAEALIWLTASNKVGELENILLSASDR